MASGPFVFHYHSAPIGSFWGEWLAGSLGLAAFAFAIVGMRGYMPASLPLAVPAILLLAVFIQFALGRLPFVQLGLLYAGYLTWAALLVLLGSHLAVELGIERFTNVLAIAVLLAALLGACISLLQWTGLAAQSDWVFFRPGSVNGNLGQSNHHAHYLWLGMISAFYFRGRGCIPRGGFWLLLCLLALGSTLTGSRSVFLYWLLLFCLLLWLKWRQPALASGTLLIDGLLLLPVLLGASFLPRWLDPLLPGFLDWIAAHWPALGLGDSAIRSNNLQSSAIRLYEEVSGIGARLAIWQAGWLASLAAPWLGHGAGSFPHASFMAAAGQSGLWPASASERAHNLPIDLLTEFGAPATLLVLAIFTYWAVRVFRLPWQWAHFWCVAVLGVGAIHSMLEYPLWYSFFLGLAAVLMGGLSATNNTALIAFPRARFYLAVAAISGGVMLYSLQADYRTIEDVVYRPFAAHSDREQAWRASMRTLPELQRRSLLAPWALVQQNMLTELGENLAEERALLCERGIAFMPPHGAVVHCALQQAIAGRAERAEQLLVAAWRAYPGERKAILAQMEAASVSFPQLANLKVFASRLSGG